MKHVPNILTSLRIVAAIAFACFFSKQDYNACILIFALSCISDVLDGRIARKYNVVSDIGKLLDPLADKITLLVTVCCFYKAGWIPFLMLAVVFVKEVLMVLGSLSMLKANIVVQADVFGKAATVIFSAGTAAALLRQTAIFSSIGNLYLWFFAIAIGMSVIAFVHYTKKSLGQKA